MLFVHVTCVSTAASGRMCGPIRAMQNGLRLRSRSKRSQTMHPHFFVELLVRGLDELPEVHDVLDRRVVGASQHQHQFQEVAKRQLPLDYSPLQILILWEDKVDVVNQIDHIHSDLLENAASLGVLQELRELCLGDFSVAVGVHPAVSHDLLELILHKGYSEGFSLSGGHRTHHLAQDPNKHIHDSECSQQDERVHHHCVDPRSIGQSLDENSGAIHQCPVEQQGVHGLPNGPKVCLVVFGVGDLLADHLNKGDAEDVGDDGEQAEREEHGAHGCHHTLDEDQELWHGPEEAGHAGHSRQPQQPGHAQDRGVAQVAAPTAARQKHDASHHPRLRHHHEDQDGVEDEPRVLQAVPFSLEGLVTDEPLEGKVHAEAVLRYLKNHAGLQQMLGGVEVRIYRDPQCVERDDKKRHLLEVRMPGDVGPETNKVVELGDIILLLDGRLTDLVLHGRCIEEHGLVSLRMHSLREP
mmetsp:Transcript_118541/g.377876  ORF Transcript_118541/g.377876 Transcript_118541/m.377876 type:complete len:468 (-) Transcript_118541:213-1616(-)